MGTTMTGDWLRGAGTWLARLRSWLSAARYRPERHYMRGAR